MAAVSAAAAVARQLGATSRSLLLPAVPRLLLSTTTTATVVATGTRRPAAAVAAAVAAATTGPRASSLVRLASTVAEAAVAPTSPKEEDRSSSSSKTTTGGSGRGIDNLPKLVSSAWYKPHPDKAKTGGEDAYFVGTNAVGVADGVGGWAEVGVDAGLFARSIMREASAIVATGGQPLAQVFEASVAKTRALKIPGSCTVVLLQLEGKALNTLNLGDSGFMVVRLSLPTQQQIVASYRPQTQGFNTPLQVRNADQRVVQVEPGDLILTATDGVWDNLFVPELIQFLQTAQAKFPKDAGLLAAKAAKDIVEAAINRGLDEHAMSPFSKSATASGYLYRGGKLDDTTAVVSVVTLDG